MGRDQRSPAGVVCGARGALEVAAAAAAWGRCSCRARARALCGMSLCARGRAGTWARVGTVQVTPDIVGFQNGIMVR
jgi:hypothetical protein